MKTSILRPALGVSWRVSLVALTVSFLVSACGDSPSSYSPFLNQSGGAVQLALVSPGAGQTTCTSPQIQVAMLNYGDCFQNPQLVAQNIKVVQVSGQAGTSYVPVASAIPNGSISTNTCEFTLSLAQGLNPSSQYAVELTGGNLLYSTVPTSTMFYTGASGSACQNNAGGVLQVIALVGGPATANPANVHATNLFNMTNSNGSVSLPVNDLFSGILQYGLSLGLGSIGALSRNATGDITAIANQTLNSTFAASSAAVFQVNGDPSQILGGLGGTGLYNLVPTTTTAVQGQNLIIHAPQGGYDGGFLYYVYIGPLQSVTGQRSTSGYDMYFYVPSY